MKHAAWFVAGLILAVAAGCTPGTSAPENPPAATPADAGARVVDTMDYRIRVATVTDGLSFPYCFAFLPDGSILLTEMGGRLRLIRDGKLVPEPIGGTPEVDSHPPSHGLMDIALHPKFAENHLVYLSYNKSGEQGVTEAVARGVFDGTKLTGLKDIFVADAWAKTNGRQNSRIAFGPDGTLYITGSVGGKIDRAQNMKDHAGKVLRIRDDGSIPDDNPFARRAGFRPEIFTYGHQNIHGLAIRPETGELWGMEHGDEANVLKSGGNYGWPYTNNGQGTTTQTLPKPAGVELTSAAIAWDPQRRVSGMVFYTGDKFPRWKGNLFLGTLNNEQIHRVVLGKQGAEVREDLFTQSGLQVRDVRQGPDGLIYFTSFEEAGPGRLLRIEPAP